MNKGTHRISRISAGLLAVACIQGAMAGTIVVTSDATWRVSTAEMSGWQSGSFDDSAWATAMAPSSQTCGSNSIDFGSGVVAPVMWSAGEEYSAYFRKQFTVDPANVKSAVLYSNSDDDHKMFINGKKVTIEFDGQAGPTMKVDIKKYLVPGTNTLAAYAQDTYGICRYLSVAAVIETPSLGGSVVDSTIRSVTCTNVTTGQSVTLSDVKGTTRWDCLTAGLVVKSGDVVKEIVNVKVN
ncbi:hypothetical protein [Ideonella sp.]|uniref:hypothetical protein n=1 Tax=Ideonella sp. TaxID=1929293 RepID=UPI003BB5BC69